MSAPGSLSAPAETASAARRALALLAAFVTMNLAGGLIAFAMNPLVGPAFGTLIRDPEREGLHLPSLLGGYAVVSIVLGVLHGRLRIAGSRAGAGLGLLLGLAVFFGGHLVTAGWSTMPAGAMAVSGALDAVAVAAGGAAFALVASSRTKGRST